MSNNAGNIEAIRDWQSSGFYTKSQVNTLMANNTTVIANPTGTATDDLNKLQVGSTIYAVDGGGGSGGDGGGVAIKRINLTVQSSPAIIDSDPLPDQNIEVIGFQVIKGNNSWVNVFNINESSPTNYCEISFDVVNSTICVTVSYGVDFGGAVLYVYYRTTGGGSVVANPSGTALVNLSKLKVGDTIYDIKGQVDDLKIYLENEIQDYVRANPSGTATESLNKIAIDDTIYSISGGSSGMDDNLTMSGLTARNNMTMDSGGYKKLSDKMVLVQIIMSTISSSSSGNVRILSGLPQPSVAASLAVTGSVGSPIVSDTKPYAAQVKTNGDLYMYIDPSDMQSGTPTYSITGIYTTAS